MSLSEKDAIFIEHAEPAGDLRLKLSFSDGNHRIVDFGPFLASSRNPLIRAYLDPALFAQFTIKAGDIFWGDYDLCFPIADLYEGRL